MLGQVNVSRSSPNLDNLQSQGPSPLDSSIHRSMLVGVFFFFMGLWLNCVQHAVEGIEMILWFSKEQMPKASHFSWPLPRIFIASTSQESFSWSLGLVSRMLVRTIKEGSTIVMKAINQNSKAPWWQMEHDGGKDVKRQADLNHPHVWEFLAVGILQWSLFSTIPTLQSIST